MLFAPPTHTAKAESLTLSIPNVSITQVFPTEARPRHISRLHPRSLVAIPPHWHATHTEHLRVLRGWVMITLGTTTKLYGPESGVVDIPPYTIHSFARGDHPDARHLWIDRMETETNWENEDVLLEEWTTPWEGQKELFFRIGMSFFTDNLQEVAEGRWTFSLIPALLARAMWLLNFSAHADNYPLVVGFMLGCGSDGKATVFARMTTGLVLGMAKLTAAICGWKPWMEEYTPVQLQAVAKTM